MPAAASSTYRGAKLLQQRRALPAPCASGRLQLVPRVLQVGIRLLPAEAAARSWLACVLLLRLRWAVLPGMVGIGGPAPAADLPEPPALPTPAAAPALEPAPASAPGMALPVTTAAAAAAAPSAPAPAAVAMTVAAAAAAAAGAMQHWAAAAPAPMPLFRAAPLLLLLLLLHRWLVGHCVWHSC